METLKFILRLISDTYREWSKDRAARLGAALAYYALLLGERELGGPGGERN